MDGIFKGKTVNDALTEALIALGTTSDKVEYEVIEAESSGFFGIGKKEAVIRVTKKEEEEEDIIKEIFGKETKKAEPVIKDETEVKDEPDVKAGPDVKEEAVIKEEPFIKEKAVEKENIKGKTEKEEINKEETKEKVKTERVSIPAGEPVDTEKIKTFVESVIEKMGIEGTAEVSVDDNEKCINVNINGKDAGDLIGKRGQTLDALQYLTSIIANKNREEYFRVKLDTKNYRDRRQKTLENLAKNCAYKVKKTRRKVVLDPMNPYERRIIHSYLQKDPRVETKSEGEEPNRKVVIYYKR